MDASVNTLLQIAGAAACAAVVVIAARDAVAWSRRRRRLTAERQQERQDFRREVDDAVRRAAERAGGGLAWEGERPLRVVAITDECRGVKSFYLADPSGAPLPRFLPGQHLTVHPQPPDGSDGVVRCYSLSDRPREESYRITVKRCPPPDDAPGAPPGAGSTFLHERVRVGDELVVGAPRGDFRLDPDSDKPIVLAAGGIGVTPLLSMALELAHRGVERDVSLFLGLRSEADFPFRETLAELRGAPRVRVAVSFSQPSDAGALDPAWQRAGRVTTDYLRSELPSRDAVYYLCGPPAMMQSLAPGLLEWGVPTDDLRYEAFGPAAVTAFGSEPLSEEAIGALVRFAQHGAEAIWSEESHTLLELAEGAGVPLESGCRVGNCGRCATPVVAGSVRTIRRPGSPTPPGQCLACISVPTTPLVLDA